MELTPTKNSQYILCYKTNFRRIFYSFLANMPFCKFLLPGKKIKLNKNYASYWFQSKIKKIPNIRVRSKEIRILKAKYKKESISYNCDRKNKRFCFFFGIFFKKTCLLISASKLNAPIVCLKIKSWKGGVGVISLE